MKRYIFLLVTLFVVVLTITAQSGGITPDMLREIQNVQPLSPADKAISNAIAANSIDALAKNRDNARALDTYFNIGGRLRVEGGGLRVEGGGLKVEGGGLRVEG